jgi:hypothetical protein
VNVFSRLDIGNHSADVLSVFGDRVANPKVFQGELVSEGNVHSGADFEWSSIVQCYTLDQFSRLNVDHRHADVVLLVVNQKVNHVKEDSCPFVKGDVALQQRARSDADPS